MSNKYNESIVRGIVFEKTVIEALLQENGALLCDCYTPYLSEEGVFPSTDYKYEKTYCLKYDGFISNKLKLDSFGLDEIVAKRIIIEVKYNPNNYLDSSVLKHFSRELTSTDTCIVIFCIKNTKEEAPGDSTLSNYISSGQIRIIDKDKLIKNKILAKFFKKYSKLISEKNSYLFPDYFEELKKTKTDLSFAIGAGCSVDAHISNWNTLSEAMGYELLYGMLDSDASFYNNMKIADSLNKEIFKTNEKNTALDVIYQGLIKTSLTEENYFLDLRKVIYMTFNSKTDTNTSLVKSIIDCIKRNSIEEIINYNFDSVLELSYDSSYKHNSTEVLSSVTKIGNCLINHVHGYIPYDYKGKETVSNLVFTDSEYYDNLLNKTNFCNSTQKRIFSSKNVVFVGVSFTDENIKERLRERMSTKSTNNIFGFKKIPDFRECGDREAVLKNKYRLIYDNYFNSLGVKIIWVNKYDEIPGMIDQL